MMYSREGFVDFRGFRTWYGVFEATTTVNCRCCASMEVPRSLTTTSCRFGGWQTADGR